MSVYGNPQMVNSVQYPETYYMVQPIVSRACMEMDDSNGPFPSQTTVNYMTDRAYDDVIRTYPEMIEDDENEAPYAGHGVEADQFRRRRRFRRRELLRDLVGILLIGELLRRRRRF